jgi:hypothetical protein
MGFAISRMRVATSTSQPLEGRELKFDFEGVKRLLLAQAEARMIGTSQQKEREKIDQGTKSGATFNEPNCLLFSGGSSIRSSIALEVPKTKVEVGCGKGERMEEGKDCRAKVSR